MLKRLIIALFLLTPALVWAGSSKLENASAQICSGPVSITCETPPCFPFTDVGENFSGANSYYWLNINLTSGTYSLDLEGTNPGGVFGNISTLTTGVNGFLATNPPVIRAVITACTACVGTMVLCGNS